MAVEQKAGGTRQFWIAVSLSIFAALAFYASTKATLHDLDYTNQIALALLSGHLGLHEQPPDWLNEMIPLGGAFYSAFPLGAVLSMLPVALLQKFHVIHNFPGHILAALIAACCVYFFFQLTKAFGSTYSILTTSSVGRRSLLALFPIFGTWTWCNLGFGGAWQIALGLAVLGQAAALYFTLVRRCPFAAGIFFALAFGNRTELLITLPIYVYFFWQRPATASLPPDPKAMSRTALHWEMLKRQVGSKQWMLLCFLSVPGVLALLTAGYNYARFHSIFDFGYFHIPEVRQEPWYEHGLFSIHAIPWNMYTMLFSGFESISYFPYIRPSGFDCSILLASPFLCLIFRQGGKYKIAAWVVIVILTLVLWCHGNPGSWQFSYRYAMILLPWMFLLLTGNGPPKLTLSEVSLFLVSVAINAIATWQFLWTDQIQP